MEPLGIPEDTRLLAQWLGEREAMVGDVLPHASKQIVWANPGAPSRTDRVVVYLHGFSATREELRPFPDSLAAALDANLLLTRLTGHGRPGAAMAEATAGAWLADGREAMALAQRLGDRVVLVGTSTGGTLATWIAGQPEYAERLEAAVLFSPNFRVPARGTGLALLPWGRHLLRLVLGAERTWTPENPEQGRAWTTSYPSEAVAPMLALVRHVNRQNLTRLRVPLFVGYSPADQVVDPEAIEEAAAEWGSAAGDGRHVRVVADADPPDRSNHILTGEIMAPGTTPLWTQRVMDFLEATRP